jgi:hypothetical protein
MIRGVQTPCGKYGGRQVAGACRQKRFNGPPSHLRACSIRAGLKAHVCLPGSVSPPACRGPASEGPANGEWGTGNGPKAHVCLPGSASPPACRGPASPPACRGPASPPACRGPASPPACRGPASPPACRGPASPPACRGPASPPACLGSASPPACRGRRLDGADRRPIALRLPDRPLRATKPARRAHSCQVAPLIGQKKTRHLPTATRPKPDRPDNPNRPMSILSNSEPALCALAPAPHHQAAPVPGR